MTTVPQSTRFAMLPADRAADDLERELLARWEAEDLFARTITAAEGKPSFVFFEGPPTANGRPGIHHVFARTIKDLFCRHRAMKGFRVLRKAGWDTHGLPVEIEVEKKLGISGKQQIEALGVAEFNRLSRESVFTYRGDWEKLSARIGYWLDYAHPYVTYHNEYVESVWWALRTLHDKGYLYRGHKILPYCPRCGTALSSHEVAQGYEDVQDPSVYVALALADDAAPAGRRILVWTTTPWTLVSNTALAVHPDLAYIELVRKEGDDRRTVILAESRVKAVLGDDFAARWTLVRLLRGAELVGMRYRRPLDWLPYPPGEHEIIVGEEFVSAEDGTGVVHMSPAFGADDYAAGQRHGLAFLQPVNAQGEFPADLPLVGGKFIKDADPLLIEELKRRGVLWKAGKITHAYPHCWRCGTPLLYYARTSWFVRTTAYRDDMLARNARVDWHPPEVGEGRFGEWLKNNIDWAISRDRYWGTPLPVWVCDADDTHVHVVGGFAELAERSGAALPGDFDPHKPHVDGYAWSCVHAGCTGTMRRVPEVIDTWFDSGSMSFAQWGYPHQPGSRESLARQYPADFIAEGVDQTRGWFYSLLAIATGLGDALPNNAPATDANASAPPAPYGHVVVNDLVLDADGQKMSKSRGNVVDPWTVLAQYGADAVRLFLVASSDIAVPRKFDERAIREQAVRFLLTLRNVYSGMFAQYANYGWEPSAADPAPADRPAMDRWMLSRLAAVEAEVDDALERYDATSAARALIRFVDDDVANWYVRLSRARFYDVDGDDNRAAFATLHEVLVATCRLVAPFAPFLSDWMHRELTGGSVHLAPYVRADAPPRDDGLERAMAAVRMLATLGRAAREDAGVKVRQPLTRLVCVAPDVPEETLTPLVGLLASELNVKRVDFARTGDALVTLEAKPNFRALGKKFGKLTPLAAQAIQAFTSDELRAFLGGRPLAVSAGGESHELEADDVTIVRRASGDLVVQEEAGFFAALDPAVTPELRLEGTARELISRIQRLRKDSGLAVSDRIVLYVGGDAGVEAAVRAHGEWIGREVLATRVVWRADGVTEDQATMPTVAFDETTARIAITKAE
ncbi:MAG TPA: isoleucine--tRNA ligase [Gemmatimonadaceae bacterium]|nr:isoleucine--tRNA ligase [Gemmatimonadaceae bacterium]